MGSKYPPGFYDDETLSAMESAFRNVWKAMAMSDPFHDITYDDELRAKIVRKLMDLVGEGVRSSDELRAQALRSLLL